MTVSKPLLLLDVDGPLNPYRQLTKAGYLPPKRHRSGPPYVYEKHLMRPEGWTDPVDLPVLISEQMGADLNGLQDVFDLVWATTWEHEANRLLSPLLGLPSDLPVIPWPPDHIRDQWTRQPSSLHTGPHNGSWKTLHILRWLDTHGLHTTPEGTSARRSWVWVDDDIRKGDRRLAHHWYTAPGTPPPAAFQLLHIEPTHGLRPHNLQELRHWAAAVVPHS